MLKKYIFAILDSEMWGIYLLFILTAQQSLLFAQSKDESAYIKLEEKKGWIISEDFKYTGDIGEDTNFRWLKNNFLFWYIFNDTWSFQIDVPLEYYYYGVREHEHEEEHEDEEHKALHLFLVKNIKIFNRYSFDWNDYRWQLFLGVEAPTYSKIGGSYPVESDQIDEQKFWAVEPGFVISRVHYPLLLFLKLSFSQPFYREYERDDVFSLWAAEASIGFDFIINNKISWFTHLSSIQTESKATFIIQAGFVHSLTPQLEYRIYLSHEYCGYIKQSFIGLSFYYLRIE
jgi:hypothetical protein